MSTGTIVLLGAIAGATIFLGLPLGRMRNPDPRVPAFLNAFAVGILLFLLWDVLSHANEPVEEALVAAAVEHTGSWARFAGLAFTFVGGLGVGLLSLVYYDRWNARRHVRLRPAGPGAAHVDELEAAPTAPTVATGAGRLAFFIALGIGLHNFSEGLAIGQSAAAGEVSLALLLVIGFGLHNATEGFGIVGPLTGEPVRPSWGFLALLGVIGGGPTFVGTILGQSMVNDVLFLAFLALAAGSILYVVIQLLRVAAKMGYKELLMWGVLAGLLLGLATDYVLVAAGG